MARRSNLRPSFLRKYSTASLVSFALHAALVVMLVVGLPFAHRQEAARPQTVAIQATVVDESRIEQEVARLEQQERAEIERRQREEREARAAAEAARREREREQQRLEQTRRESERAAEQERTRLAEAQREREAEERRRAEAERQRRAEEERLAQQRAEEEQRRTADAARRRQEAAAARRQAEREAELQSAMAAEEERRAAERAGLLDEYIRLIENRIQQNWIAPASARVGLECVVNVTQIPSGDVVDVRVGQCNGDEAVVRSIEAAVLRASPLPRPPTPALFERNLVVTFRPEL